jgi:hypothetical protein
MSSQLKKITSEKQENLISQAVELNKNMVAMDNFIK